MYQIIKAHYNNTTSVAICKNNRQKVAIYKIMCFSFKKQVVNVTITTFSSFGVFCFCFLTEHRYFFQGFTQLNENLDWLCKQCRIRPLVWPRNVPKQLCQCSYVYEHCTYTVLVILEFVSRKTISLCFWQKQMARYCWKFDLLNFKIYFKNSLEI